MKYNCPNVPSKPSQPDIPPTIEQLQFALKQAELRKCIESSKSTYNVIAFYYRVQFKVFVKVSAHIPSVNDH